MKKLILISIIVAFSSDIFSQQTTGVAINNNNADPDPSAILHLTSTDKGILIPRMTEVDKMAISIPANGLMIYQTDGTDPGFYFYDGISSLWKPLDGTVNTLDDLTDAKVAASSWPGIYSVWIANGDDVGAVAKTGTLNDARGNISIGPEAGNSITSGDANILMGYRAGTGITNQERNTIIGYWAGISPSIGNSNVFIGEYSGENSEGSGNTAIGSLAKRQATGGNGTTFIGLNAGLHSTGDYGIGVGRYAGASFEGWGNIAIGNQVGYDPNPLFPISGDRNILIGYYTKPSSNTVSTELTIGDGRSGEGIVMRGTYPSKGNSKLMINPSDSEVPSATLHVKGEGTSNSTTSFLVEDSGGDDLLTVKDDGVLTINDAYSMPNTVGSPNQVLTSDGVGTITWEDPFIGTVTSIDDLSDATTPANSNIGLGANALDAISTGDYNVALGIDAGKGITIGEQNIAIGWNALEGLTTGDNNTIVGSQAANKTGFNGSSNVIMGTLAGGDINTSQSNNVIIGFNAGRYISSPSNVIIGSSTVQAASLMTTGYNTVVGQSACNGMTSGQQNVAFGFGSNAGTTGSFNTCINRGVAGSTGAGNIQVGANYSTTTHQTGSYSVKIGTQIPASATSASYEFLLGGNNRLLMNGDYTTEGEAKLLINPGATVQTPLATLHVKGEGTSNSTTSFLVEDSGGDDLVTVKDDGNVGIGTALPAYELDVTGDVNLTGSLRVNGVAQSFTDDQDLTLAGNTLSLTNDATTVDLAAYLDNTDAQDLSLTGNTLTLTNDATAVDLSPLVDELDFSGGGTGTMYATSSGDNIVIGNTSPTSSEWDMVNGVSNAKIISLQAANTYADESPCILELQGSSSTNGDEIGVINFVQKADHGQNYNFARISAHRENANATYSSLRFYTRKLSTMTEAMRIDQDANVGIGNASPVVKLDVEGAVKTSRLGTYGTYSSSQVQGIWSISEGYTIDDVSDDFGTQYGMGYAYNQNGGSPFANEHQIVFTNNGSINAAIGLGGSGYFGGNVGIGITAPSEKLVVAGSIYASSGDLYAAAYNGVINCGGGIMTDNLNYIGDTYAAPSNVSGDEDLYIQDDLQVDGNAYKPGGGFWAAASDKRLKKNIVSFNDGLEELVKVKPVKFNYNEKSGFKDLDKQYIGIIAQELLEVAPYMVEESNFWQEVVEDENGVERIVKEGEKFYTVDPSAFTYILINSVQEQQEIIENQKEEIDELKAKVKEIDELKKQMKGMQQTLKTFTDK